MTRINLLRGYLSSPKRRMLLGGFLRKTGPHITKAIVPAAKKTIKTASEIIFPKVAGLVSPGRRSILIGLGATVAAARLLKAAAPVVVPAVKAANKTLFQSYLATAKKYGISNPIGRAAKLTSRHWNAAAGDIPTNEKKFGRFLSSIKDYGEQSDVGKLLTVTKESAATWEKHYKSGGHLKSLWRTGKYEKLRKSTNPLERRQAYGIKRNEVRRVRTMYKKAYARYEEKNIRREEAERRIGSSPKFDYSSTTQDYDKYSKERGVYEDKVAREQGKITKQENRYKKFMKTQKVKETSITKSDKLLPGAKSILVGGAVPWAGEKGEFLKKKLRPGYMKQRARFGSWKDQPRDEQGRWA